MHLLDLEQFKEIMESQRNKVVTLSHIGSFCHSCVYEKFSFSSFSINDEKYIFTDLKYESLDDEFVLNTISKENILYYVYHIESNQVEIGLDDENIILIDLSDGYEFDNEN